MNIPEFKGSSGICVDERLWSSILCLDFAPGQGELRNKEHSEPPLFRPTQPGKGQHEDLMLSPLEHCHKWRELLAVEQPFT